MLTNVVQLKKRLTETMDSEGYRPLKAHELADEIGLPSRQRASVRALLKEMAGSQVAFQPME
jgi:hypothetical protein